MHPSRQQMTILNTLKSGLPHGQKVNIIASILPQVTPGGHVHLKKLTDQNGIQHWVADAQLPFKKIAKSKIHQNRFNLQIRNNFD